MAKIKLNAASGGGSVAFEGPASLGSDKVIKFPNSPNVPIQTIHKDYRAFFSTAALIPLDDTIPQNTEGAEVFTQAITPTATSSKILITVVLNIANDNASNLHVAALFRDSVANAIAAGWAKTISANAPNSPMVINFLDSPSTTSAVTYKVRIGYSANSASTVQVNGGSGARYLGGALASGMTLMEISA